MGHLYSQLRAVVGKLISDFRLYTLSQPKTDCDVSACSEEYMLQDILYNVLVPGCGMMTYHILLNTRLIHTEMLVIL